MWDELLHRALSGEGVRSVYQPIVDMHRRVITGFEALARFDLVPGLRPDHWFAAAALRGLAAELDLVTLRAALAHRSDLPRNCFLAVNVEPESLLAPSVNRLFAEQADLRGLIVELTEHRRIDDPTTLEPALDRLRGAGALVAVDDAGSGYSGLETILNLRPALLKLDRSLVHRIDEDQARVALVETLGVLASHLDAWLLAEGVETAGEARRLADLGVPLAQGHFLGRPGEPWAELADGVSSVLGGDEADERPALCALAEPTPWAYADEGVAALEQLVEARPLLVLIDRQRRPLGLLTPHTALRADLIQPLRVNVHTTPAELARRISTRRPPDTTNPAIVTDNAGRYIGTVAVARLLAHLATEVDD